MAPHDDGAGVLGPRCTWYNVIWTGGLLGLASVASPPPVCDVLGTFSTNLTQLPNLIPHVI